jgi:hypothetical protein
LAGDDSGWGNGETTARTQGTQPPDQPGGNGRTLRQGRLSGVEMAFAPFGVQASFAGFEKLFVFPAKKCSFYP